jgi:4-aminobutyrate aminotransferase
MTELRPRIVVSPPGPEAEKIIERDGKILSPSLTRTAPLVGVEAEGVWVKDIDGNVYLDFGSGIAVVNVGHRHPEVVNAIIDQVNRCIHINSCDYYTIPQVELAEKLAEITPGNFKKRVFFSNSGTEAIECGIKVAKWHTRRYYFLGFIGAFHGRTMGSLSFTTTSVSARRYYAPMMPGVIHVPYAYCYRCLFKQIYPECGLWCINYIEDVVFKKIVSPEEVAGILVEPILGASGYVVPPDEFLPRLKRICEENDIMFIADEVQTGFARTGKMWACEHWNVVPDIMCIAKAMAGGLPAGACITRREIMDWSPSSHENTLGGNPIVMSAALAVLRIIFKERLAENAKKMGEYMMKRLKEMQEDYEMIGDVRGKGLMIGVELVKDRKTKTLAKAERDRLIMEAFKRGLLLLGAGESSLRLAPPLIINKEQIDIGLEIIEQSLKAIEKPSQGR